jgi:predicted O-methyltransferase YrrM
VYNSFQLGLKFIRYYVTAFNGKGHGLHSPFVFDFILHVLNNGKNYVVPNEVETLRNELQNNHSLLQIEDLGAGSRKGSSKQKKISSLAKTAVKPKKYSQLLYRLARHYHPKTIVELGTSLGITTCYLAKAALDAQVITVEGSQAIHDIAVQSFTNLGITNIQSHKGNFDDVLPNILQTTGTIDLAYIDGNHRKEPTLHYFHQFLAVSGNETILVFDDIHWSKEMEEAWQEIKEHPSVRCTIEIFFLGFVFLRKEFKEQQHFTIRF